MKAIVAVSALGVLLLAGLVARASGTRQLIAGRRYRWSATIEPPISDQGIQLMSQTLLTTGASDLFLQNRNGKTHVEFTMRSTTTRHTELGEPILTLPAPSGESVTLILTDVKELETV